MVEPEVAFIDLNGVMDLAEAQIQYVVGRAMERCAKELKTLERDTAILARAAEPFPRIHYKEAQSLLQKLKQEFATSEDPEKQKLSKDVLSQGLGADLGAADETAIGMHYKQCVCIHHYPRAVKAYYMKADPAEPEYALGVDVIAPEGVGEIIGGGQREDDLEVLQAQIKKHNIPPETVDWYVDLRRYGTVPHGGFGMGVERCVQWITAAHRLRIARRPCSARHPNRQSSGTPHARTATA
jgi:asparaginyl-tRNA synthetase